MKMTRFEVRPSVAKSGWYVIYDCKGEKACRRVVNGVDVGTFYQSRGQAEVDCEALNDNELGVVEWW